MSSDRSGELLGTYRLTRLLGRGGFAEIYLGEHIHLGTQAAIKILHTTLAEEDLELFRSEARTVARLIHPHIVRVLDFDIEQQVPFLVMEYASGGTLRQRHPRGSRLPLPTVVSYVAQVAQALQYAHNQRLIHRDIKPENMLLDQHGRVLLSDFGIALASQSSRYRSPQEVAGTTAYMAPEQFQGNAQRASDQYALAVVIYEWLSGQRLFSGSFTEIASQHFFKAPPPLREQLPTLPTEVEQVLFTALAKQPEQRFPSIEQFSRALHIAFEQTSVANTPFMPATFTPSLSAPMVPTPVQAQQGAIQSPTGIAPMSAREAPVLSQPTPALDTSPKNLLHTSQVQGNSISHLPLTPQSPLIEVPNSSWAEHALPPGGAAEWIGSGDQISADLSARVFTPHLSQHTALDPSQGARSLSLPTHTPRVLGRAIPLWQGVVLAALALLLIAGSLFAYFAVFLPSAQLQAARQATASASMMHQSTVNAIATMRSGQAATVQAQTATAQSRQTATVQAQATTQAQIIATAGAQGKPQLLWTFTTGDAIFSSATVVNGVAYVGSNDHNLYAINIVTGKQEWAYTTYGRIFFSSSMVNGIVYTTSDDSHLYAIDAATGQQKWAFAAKQGITSTPVVVNGIVYTSSGDGKLYAVDAITGQQKWAFAARDAFWSSPVVANGIVYAASRDHKLYAVDAITGQQKWAFTAAYPFDNSPTVANGVVYVGGSDRNLYAIDAASGRQKWAFTTGDVIWSSPTVANGVVYIGSNDHKLYAVDAASCQQKWSFTTGDNVWSSPIVANGVVYAGSMDHNIYAIDAATGQKKWAFPTGGAIQYSSAKIFNGVLYIGSMDHKIYAIAIGGPQ